MAKLRINWNVRHGKPIKNIKIHASIRRVTSAETLGSSSQMFKACVHTGKSEACSFGRNPRKALASALRDFAKKTAARSGAFAGLRRRSKKRRRR